MTSDSSAPDDFTRPNRTQLDQGGEQANRHNGLSRDLRRRRRSARTRQISTRVTEKARHRAERLCDLLDCSMADLLEDALRVYEAKLIAESVIPHSERGSVADLEECGEP